MRSIDIIFWFFSSSKHAKKTTALTLYANINKS